MSLNIGDPKNKKVLDFGCGAGQFAHRLAELGYHVEGIDESVKMIGTAKARCGLNIDFRSGGLGVLPDGPSYDVITSIMVLQFIPNFEAVINRLAVTLTPRGLLVLAVFNPDFIVDWLKNADPNYVGFDSVDNPTTGTMLFGKVQVPTYIRTVEQYSKVAVQNGLTLSLEAYPPFSEEFLAKYPVGGPTVHAEHMILGFKKSRS